MAEKKRAHSKKTFSQNKKERRTMQTFKDAKRRIVQSIAESVGKAERVKRDEEQVKIAMENFHQIETEIKTLTENIRNSQLATQKWSEKNQILAQNFASFFSSSSSNEEAESLKTASSTVAAAAVRGNEVIQRSAAKLIEDRAISVLEQALNERFPLIRKKIAQHHSLETDLSSYTRRVKAMMEKKPDTDPELVKLREKMQKTDETYTRVHNELLSDINQLMAEKHSIIRPVFLSVVAAQAELQKVLANEYNQAVNVLSNGPDTLSIRNEMAELIESGGPGDQPIFKTGHVSLSLKGILRNKAANNNTNDPPNSPTNSSSGRKDVPPPPPPANSLKFVDVPSFTNASVPVATLASSQKPFVAGCQCEAIFDYDGPDDGDLSFKIGETITLVEELQTGWWHGKKENGDAGLIPETYLKRID